jgi:hypothetical protein
MDSLDTQSFVLRTELADSQDHASSADVVGNNRHAPGNDPSLSMEHKSADTAYEVAHRQDGTYPLTASPGRDKGDEHDATNIDDDDI